MSCFRSVLPRALRQPADVLGGRVRVPDELSAAGGAPGGQCGGSARRRRLLRALPAQDAPYRYHQVRTRLRSQQHRKVRNAGLTA